MNQLEKTTLEATLLVAKVKSVDSDGRGPHIEAREIFASMDGPAKANLEEVSVALLQLRDDGMVETCEPTKGDPGDGKFSVHLTAEGVRTATTLAQGPENSAF